MRNGTKCSQVIVVGGNQIGGQGRVIIELKELLTGTWVVPIKSLDYPGGGNVWSGYKEKKDTSKFGSGWQGAKHHQEGMHQVHEIGKYILRGMRLIKAGSNVVDF